MACVQPDGTPSPLANKVLAAVASGQSEAEIAQAVGLPLYRIRASLRELREAGLHSSDAPHAT